MTKPKQPGKKAPAGGGGSPVTSKSALIDWAHERVGAARHCLVRPRLVIARNGVVEDVTPQVPAALHGVELIHAAAIHYRVIEPRDFVGVLMVAEMIAKRGDPPRQRSLLEAWSPAGGALHKTWEVRGNQFRICDHTPSAWNRRMDFGAHDFLVDLQIENALAKVDFPGAVPRRSAWTPTGELGAWQEAPTYLHLTGGARVWPWESARTHARELDRIAIATTVHPTPAARRPISLPLELASPWQVLHQGPYTDEEVLGFTAFYNHGPDVLETIRALVVHPSVTPRLRIAILAWGCIAIAERKLPGQTRVIPPMMETAAAEIARAGSALAWVTEQWPERLGPRDSVGPSLIASMATTFGFQAAVAQDRGTIEAAIARLDAFRDALLDRAGIPPGPAGLRVAALALRALRGSEATATRFTGFGLWVCNSKSELSAQFVEVAGFHAALLHSQAAILMSFVGAGLVGGDLTVLPYQLDLAGVFDEARAALARLSVVGAMRFERVTPELAAELLDFAATQATFEPIVLSCANEGRFRLGVRTPELLASLDREPPGLTRFAESLSIAEAIGHPRRATLARQLAKEASGTEPLVRWGAVIRAMGFQPEPMSDLDRVRGYLRTKPPPLPRAYPDSRAVYALFGPDPETTIRAWTRRLEAQEAALEEASVLRNERIEEMLTRPAPPRKERPPVPSKSGPGAVDDALAALRWRLSRPAATNLRLHKALYEHARAALRLQAAESDRAIDIDEWLVALGAPEIGLVSLLDAFLRTGDQTPVAIALDLAEETLRAAMRDAWVERTRASLKQASAALADAGAEAAAEVGAAGLAFGNAHGAADTEDVRREIDAAIAALFRRIDERRRTAPTAERDLDEAPADDFMRMEFEPGAIERSGTELGTPEWAIDIGVRQVGLYNESRGRRDLKRLKGTAAGEAALWELRHHDARHPVRVVWRFRAEGPRAIAIMVKDDEDDQRRKLKRIKDW